MTEVDFLIKVLILASTILLSMLFACQSIKDTSDLVIPTKDSIISDGYPTNENGQTYGPNMENLMLVEPDLMLAEGVNGVLGYIYQPEGISSPSELDAYNKSFKESTPLYLQDGKTIIGTFYFTH
ncbi:hypothetical protein AC625_12495 [Peribacillus loiseleuriae]|uniref:Uncharacterized protein n=1 Tax=Peribacillus loiseleuriae TaxID=1679170 RepID=A0A0K9GU98_9BACI|nr:hypothetical protein AC625_12495 [Peribacillus loiseleuriae]